ncbi:MAG TPA: HNH endonuclease [Cryomorphaceae bacterium]|nr:HNH endonuclease [Cryomorphaceae bacterium]
MIRSFPAEEWKSLPFEKGSLRLKYVISNFGRIVSYSIDFEEDGKVLKGGKLGGYPTFVCRPFGKSKTYYTHKLVAEHFLKNTDSQRTYVIHKDYNKLNNHVDNLAWASKKEMEEHQQKSPFVIESRAKRKIRKPYKGHKLSTTDVIRIKKKIFDPNRKTRLKIIAKQFGISEMQLYRIKSGENWSHVKID